MQTDGTKVLVVGPQPNPCASVTEILTSRGMICHPMSRELPAAEALELLKRHDFNVLLTVWSASEENVEWLAAAHRLAPKCKIILLADELDRYALAQAMVLGVYDCLPNCAGAEVLADAVQAAAEERTSAIAPKLARRVADEAGATAGNSAVQRLLRLAQAIDARDPHTTRHSEQVAWYAVRLARAMNLESAQCQAVRIAALAHDVGMIGVPDWVLAKTEMFSEEEFQLLQRHPAYGAQMLTCVSTFKEEADLVRHHHERWDGSGYPDGLAGEEIPLGARIIQVADCMDAMLMDRSYKAAYPIERMINELNRCAGTQFDPKVVRVAVRWAQMNQQELICHQSLHHS